MENGSTPPSADAGEADQNGHLPLSARLLGVGVRGVRTVGKATGVDRAVEVAAEEAIVAAVESEAVERAMARVLQGPIVEEAVQGALESEAVKKALLEAMDSELVDEVWRRLLASEEAQQLVERIAEAPEGAGLIEDIGRTIGKLTRRLDDSFERLARKVVFRRRRAVSSEHAGAVSRALAMLIDGIFVNLSFTAIVAIASLVDNAFGGSASGTSSFAIAIGSTAWLGLGSLYLVGFWSLAGQTPGMRFVGIRLNLQRLPLGRSLKRLFGLGLSVVTFGLGFLGIVFGEQRRGWEDRLAATDVIYDERRPEPAPWSRPEAAEPVAAESYAAVPSGPSASL